MSQVARRGNEEFARAKRLRKAEVLQLLTSGQVAERLAESIAEALPALQAQGAASVGEMSAKFETESAFTMSLAEPAIFFNGLESLIGPPNMINGSIFDAMAAEHLLASDAHEEMRLPKRPTTSAKEWALVTAPPLDEATGELPESRIQPVYPYTESLSKALGKVVASAAAPTASEQGGEVAPTVTFETKLDLGLQMPDIKVKDRRKPLEIFDAAEQEQYRARLAELSAVPPSDIVLTITEAGELLSVSAAIRTASDEAAAAAVATLTQRTQPDAFDPTRFAMIRGRVLKPLEALLPAMAERSARLLASGNSTLVIEELIAGRIYTVRAVLRAALCPYPLTDHASPVVSCPPHAGPCLRQIKQRVALLLGHFMVRRLRDCASD